LTTAEQWVWLALIRHTQGRKGEVFAEILTDFPDKFAERRRLWLLVPSDAGAHSRANAPPREVELMEHWLHKGAVVLRFAGIDSISDAEKLVGLAVAVPREERAALAEDEVYVGDLIGCTLVDVAGAEPVVIGEIEDVDRTAGPVALLIVQGTDGNEVLIPFAKNYLRRVNVADKRVEMALPEGLVDLNA
jgi:16S rRNA processing protein RimM